MHLDIPQSGYDAVIFDCDGTLVDSMPLHYHAWVWALKKNGFHHPFPEERHYSHAGMSIPAHVGLLNEEFGTSIDPEAINADRTEYVVEHHKHVRPIQPVVDFARSLEGKVPMSVASGSEAPIVHSTLENLSIRYLFDPVITPVDVAPGRGKPAPDMFLLAAEKMGVAPKRCLVFEDGQNGIDAANAAGMATVFVPRPS